MFRSNEGHSYSEQDVSERLVLTARIRETEERIAALLRPVESYILLFQRILVWELPYASAVLFIAIHLLFWLSTTVRIYCLFGVTCMILVALDLWILEIMKKKSDDDQSGNENLNSWTDVHPDFLGVPELSRHLAKLWVTGINLLDVAVALRTENHAKFFVSSIIYLTVLAVVGAYVPGIWIAYVTVMGLMLWPCVKYHKVFEQVEHATMPFVSRIERKLNIKRKRRRMKKGSKQKAQKTADNNDDDDESSDDQIINDFVPPVNAVILTTLTSALSSEMVWDDDDDEDLLAGHTPTGRLTPQFPSFNQSRDHSDDDLLADDLSSLTYGLGAEMPSISDVDGRNYDPRDRVGDASLDPDEELLDTTHVSEGLDYTNESNAALAASFKSPELTNESDSDADIENLAAGLVITDDALDVTDSSSGAAPGIGETLLGGILSQGHSTLSAALSSSTVSGIVSGASSGFSALRDVVRRSGLQIPSLTQSSATKADDPVNENDVLDAEFEFLNSEELE